MHPVVADRIEEVRRLCGQRGVAKLWLFGSAAAGDFEPGRSDLDFLVEFYPGPRAGFEDRYFLLLDDLRALFGRDIDLAEVGTITNPFVLASVDRTRVPLYDAA